MLYDATLQSLAYGTREIIEKLNDGDYSINTIYFAGGGAKNALLLQETADITRCEIVLPETNDAVLLGSAILASTAAGLYEDVETAMQAMSRAGNTISPRTETTTYHNAPPNNDETVWHALNFSSSASFNIPPYLCL